MKKLLILITNLLICSISFANVESASIPLTGGTIDPKNVLNISLNPLVLNAPYVVTCNMNIPAYNSSGVDFMPLFRDGSKLPPLYSINNTDFGIVGVITQPTNIFVAQGVVNYTYGHNSKNSTFTISNLDDTVTITVSNCIATPAVGNNKII